METANPLVSIVVRTKDRPVLLERALASIGAQAYRPIEAVVVNDGGVALDEQRLRRALGDVALRLVALAECGGRARAANVGLAAAAGAFIGFLDDDDELLPRHVLTLVTQAVLTASRVVYSDCETVVRDLGPGGEILREENEGRFFLSRDFSADVLLFENYIPLICVLFSRHSLEGGGGFDEDLELFEDWDLYLRVAARHPFHHVPEITARYIQWSRTAQIAFTGNVDGRAAYRRVLGKNAGRLDESAIVGYYLAKQADARAAADRQLALGREIGALAARIEALEHAAAERRDAMTAVEERLAEREALLDGITRSLAWRLLHVYRTRVKGALAPAGSHRRRAYDAVVGVARRRAPETSPPAPAARPVPARLPAPPPPLPSTEPGPPPGATRERFEPPARVAVESVPLMAVVSVVIPTLDAGPEFRAVLRRLRDQAGLAEVEIVAVDSGSTDGTLAACREFGVTVAPYRGERFNHGLARTQGIALTRGEYVVFMSQDAYPVGDRVLAAMARVLAESPEVAAASAREVPRSDADLFSCWQLWTFNEKILGYAADTAVGLGPGGLAALSPAGKRKAAQVNNVFCCVRRSVLAEVGIRPLPFAEDLDFGLRVLAAGHRLAFMPSVAVVHSHRRPPAYHLKRLFVDWLAQVDLLGFEPQDWAALGVASAAAMVGDARRFSGRLGGVLAAVDVGGAPAEIEERLHELLYRDDQAVEPVASPLDALLDALAGAVHPGGEPPAPTGGRMMRDRYAALVHELLDFAAGFGGLSHRAGDLRGSLLNLYAHLVGWCLADLVRDTQRRSPDDPGAAAVIAVLAGGV